MPAARDHRPRALRLEHLESRCLLAGNGLTAQYFHNSDFTGLAAVTTEAISKSWGTGSPGHGIVGDSFSVRWTGQVEPQYSQSYTFRVQSDEAARLWIDGKLVIDDWTPHAVRTRTAAVTLVAGQRYDICLDYYDVSGAARIELSWSSASQPLQVIPASRLYESPAGLLGAYRDDNGADVSRIDPTINFNWAAAAPIAGVTSNNFNVNWTGQLRADFSEEYTFSTISDDGVRLWIGGELVIDDWTTHGAWENTGSKWLEAGKWYDIRLEYFDVTGDASISLRWSSLNQTGAGLFETIPQSNLRAAKTHSFTNPLGAGADPYVTYWQGYYYLVRSSGGSVLIDRAPTLEDIHRSTVASQSLTVWTPPAGTSYSEQIWAPELHRMGANWYIYVAASDGNNATHRMQVLERKGSDPFGAFTRLGQLTADTDRWAIDGTVFEWGGKWYSVWSGWPGSTDGQQNLYIAEMRNPWSLQTDRVLLASPNFTWERYGLPINEGPQVIINDGQLFITYSGSGYWRREYAIGLLTYNGTGSLLDPANWTKSPQPVFQRNSFVVGTGHASFIQTPDGTENWIIYHAHANPTVFNEDRVVRMQPFTFGPDGKPDFGQPWPSTYQIPIPSAGASPERSFVPGDYDANGVADDLDYNVWRSTYGNVQLPGISADASRNAVVDILDYVLWRMNTGVAAASADVAQAVQFDLQPAIAAQPVADNTPEQGAPKIVANPFASQATSKPQALLSTPAIASRVQPSSATVIDNLLTTWFDARRWDRRRVASELLSPAASTTPSPDDFESRAAAWSELDREFDPPIASI